MIYRDHFQNYKSYAVPKAQLIIADIPYNLGNNAYASNPAWYKDGDNANGESELAGKEFFDTDKDFRPAEFMHFCSTMLKKETKIERTESDGSKRIKSNAPCMIVFCEFEQQFELITKAKKYGLNKYINLVFRKNFSAQVLKANMKIVGNCEYAVLLYRDKLPKFNNNGKMIMNCMDWTKDTKTEKIHPTQKPVDLYDWILNHYAQNGFKILDTHLGSGSIALAIDKANSINNMNLQFTGIELDEDYYNAMIKRFENYISQKTINFE